MKVKIKQLTIFLSLVGIDQLIKIIISSFFIEKEVNLGFFFYFKPILNKKLSWINSWLDLNIGLFTHLLVIIIGFFFISYLYKYHKYKNGTCKLLQSAYMFFLSGTVCSLIDKIFWGGSLDFIGIKYFLSLILRIFMLIVQ